MSSMRRTVRDMVHPAAMEQLAKERQNEILRSSMTRRTPAPFPKVRERLGWSLIGLGVHLALPGQRTQALRSFTRL